jgi:hypothetical protein
MVDELTRRGCRDLERSSLLALLLSVGADQTRPNAGQPEYRCEWAGGQEEEQERREIDWKMKKWLTALVMGERVSSRQADRWMMNSSLLRLLRFG